MSEVRCHHGYLPKRCTVPDCANFVCADLYREARTAGDTIANPPTPPASNEKAPAESTEVERFSKKLHARIEGMRRVLYTSSPTYGEAIGGPLLDGVQDMIDELRAEKTSGEHE